MVQNYVGAFRRFLKQETSVCLSHSRPQQRPHIKKNGVVFFSLRSFYSFPHLWKLEPLGRRA